MLEWKVFSELACSDHSPLLAETRVRTQGKDLEIGTEAETMDKWDIFFFSRLIFRYLYFTSQGIYPGHLQCSVPFHINQENVLEMCMCVSMLCQLASFFNDY